MKASKILNLKTLLSATLLASLLCFTAACSKDKKGGSSVARTNGQRTDPNNPVFTQNSSTGGWGTVMHGGEQNLRAFMAAAAQDLGTVSSGANDSTGIRIRREGNQVYILVWDSLANAEGPFYWPLAIQGQVSCSNSGARVTVTDSVGTVTFDGSFQSGYWQGRVDFQNNGGASGYLGQFQITQQNFFPNGQCN